MFEINKAMIRRWRLQLASWVAPRGADIHDPDETSCPSAEDVLTAIYRDELVETFERGPHPNYLMNVSTVVDEAYGRGLATINENGVKLTAAGVKELARLWGPGRVPPGPDVQQECPVHGPYELPAGHWFGCVPCAADRHLHRLFG